MQQISQLLQFVYLPIQDTDLQTIDNIYVLTELF